MVLEITCPICHFEHIPRERDTCPQCDSDLVCFKLLEALQEKSKTSEQDSQVDVLRKSESEPHAFLDEETWEDGQTKCPDRQGMAGGKFPWTWLAAAIIFLVVMGSFGGYVLYDLSKIKNMIKHHGTLLNQAILFREKQSLGDYDEFKAFSIKLGRLENQAEKLSNLLDKNRTQLGEIVTMQEKMVCRAGSDPGKIEDTPVGAGGVENNVAKARIRVADSINVPSGNDGAVIAMGNGAEGEAPCGPRLHLSKQSKSSGNEIMLEKTSLCFKTYKATDGDTLWDIAQHLYGQGLYYPVLLEHNPDVHIYDINNRSTLRYLCDQGQIPRIYREITAMKNNRRYWKYRLRPGDTRSSVAQRYCPRSKGCFVEDTFPEIGEIIGVFLE